MGKDSAARIELGRSFHQMGTVNEKVREFSYQTLNMILDDCLNWIIHTYRKLKQQINPSENKFYLNIKNVPRWPHSWQCSCLNSIPGLAAHLNFVWLVMVRLSILWNICVCVCVCVCWVKCICMDNNLSFLIISLAEQSQMYVCISYVQN